MAQDSTSNPGTVFAVGLTLESLSTHTVDESGQRAFVTQNPLKLLRKVLPGPWYHLANAVLPAGHAAADIASQARQWPTQ